MPDKALVLRTTGADAPEESPPSQPCVMLIFGASGDLTKRLLVPALYNLACDGLLSKNFALIGTAMDPLSTETFRERMSADIKKFHTRKEFDASVWEDLVGRFHYLPGGFDDSSVYQRLKFHFRRPQGVVERRLCIQKNQRSTIHAGAWSLAPSSPRMSRSTPALSSRGASAGLTSR